MDTTRPLVSRRDAFVGLGAGGLGLALAAHSFLASAQEATPPATGAIATVELAPGATLEHFAAAPSARAAGQSLHLIRLVFQPGAEAGAHRHPGTVLFAVAAGSWGWTLVAGTARILRGAASDAPGTEETITEVGSEVVLNAGDAITYEDDVVHTARGAGNEAAVILGALLLTEGEPVAMPADMDMSGTPPAQS